MGKVAIKYFESDFVEKVFKKTLILFNNKQQWPIGKWTKSDCAMRNVAQTFCPKLLSAERTFDWLFSQNPSSRI